MPNAFVLSVTKCNDHPLASPHTHVLACSVGVTLTQTETFARHVGAGSLWRGSWRSLEGESGKGYIATHWTENSRTTVPTLQTYVPEHFRTVTGHSRSHVSFSLLCTGDVTMYGVCIVNSGCVLLLASATSLLQPCAIDIFICSATYTFSAHTRVRTANKADTRDLRSSGIVRSVEW